MSLDLNSNEWATILLCLKLEMERKDNSADYNALLEDIILKIESREQNHIEFVTPHAGNLIRAARARGPNS